jgi:hypothetical protein
MRYYQTFFGMFEIPICNFFKYVLLNKHNFVEEKGVVETTKQREENRKPHKLREINSTNNESNLTIFTYHFHVCVSWVMPGQWHV